MILSFFGEFLMNDDVQCFVWFQVVLLIVDL